MDWSSSKLLKQFQALEVCARCYESPSIPGGAQGALALADVDRSFDTTGLSNDADLNPSERAHDRQHSCADGAPQ
jgi:hypothetical protein